MGTRASGGVAIRKGCFNTFLWQSFSDGYRIFAVSSAVPVTPAILLEFLARRTGGKYYRKYLSSSYGLFFIVGRARQCYGDCRNRSASREIERKLATPDS